MTDVPPCSECAVARQLISTFTLFDRDAFDGNWQLTIDQRVQMTINEYERHKHELYDQAEWVI